MRKQTKVVAVASAAALLAISASMTSFAATGWVEEDGTWYFYDKDGNRVEDEWKKSGDNWYWLDSEEGGAMAVDKLVEDSDDIYYVDSNGVMVRNTWVRIVNEEQDDDDDPAEYNYYYMQSSGKAYKAGDSSTTKFKTIDGKRYAFDSDGKMLYGWVSTDGSRLSAEDDWAQKQDMYYCGSWDDGAMKIGWQKIYVHDEQEDDDLEQWFYFKSNGKKEYNSDDEDVIKEKKINGRRYGFDERGVMVYEWTVASQATMASTSTWKYFSSPEDGARVTKGWFKVVAANEDNTFSNTIENLSKSNTFDYTNADDETEKWYYANGDGNIKAGEIAKIKGKYYAFHPDGWMLNGLVFMSVDKEGKINIYNDDYKDVDSDELDDIMDLNSSEAFDTNGNPYSLYYFGNDEDQDGAMKTGATTVTLDGESYNFLFSKTGGVEGKGRGLTGIDDNKYIYKFGKKLKAGSDDKYIVVKATGDTGTNRVEVMEVDKKDLRSEARPAGTNKDGDTVKYVGTIANFARKNDNSLYYYEDFFLLNTSGTIVKSKTAARDGDDWYFYVKDSVIKMYTNNKTLAKGSGENAGTIDSDFDSYWKDHYVFPVIGDNHKTTGDPEIDEAHFEINLYD